MEKEAKPVKIPVHVDADCNIITSSGGEIVEAKKGDAFEIELVPDKALYFNGQRVDLQR